MDIDSPNQAHLPELRTLWREAFDGSEEYLQAFEKTAFAAERCRCVMINGKLCSALYWFDCSYQNRRIAYLYAIATLKAYQGQGLCSALMNNTHEHLESLGYEGAVLVPSSEALFVFYKKFGYKTCCHVNEFACSASNAKVGMHQIEADEYARLRRKFLPDGAVIQERENLKYLTELAVLYAGDNFLLAAQPDGNSLFGMELLGDTSAAPGILHTSGFSSGMFRSPGNDIPFAMYRSLCDNPLVPPTYFGLAFE